jgi:signal transduction histidine kinase
MLADRPGIQDIRNTSTFRLSVVFGLVFAVSVAVLLGLIYGLSARELNRRSDRIMRLEALRLEAASPERLPDRIRAEIARSASGLNYFELESARGDHVVGNVEVRRPLPFDQPVELAPGRGTDVPIRLLAVRTSSDETLVIGRDISPVLDLRRRVLTILVGSGLATAVAVLLSGILLSLRPLRRVRDLQRASRMIAAGSLDTRMPLAGRGDELDLFAGTVNTMVEEVGRVIGQVKDVTDAIAHDLRTPLTRVRAQLYRLCQTPGLPDALTSLIETATVDLDLVLDRFAALLRISELEASGRRAGFGTIDLGRLIARVYDLYEPLAEDRAILLVLEPAQDVIAHGDEKLLFEATSNLVDNAIKFTPPGGRVVVSAVKDANGPVIAVRDDGPGIAEDERRAVLRRFHRSATTIDVPGTGLGLGLSVVAAILHLHGFTLDFSDADPGLLVRIVCTDGVALAASGEIHFTSISAAKARP